MSYLDNLENSLKALESREEKDPREAGRRKEEREAALAAQPHAEALKNGPFTEKLLTATRQIGHAQRTMVRFTWLDGALRLEAKEKRLDLRPTANGIEAVESEGGVETKTYAVDLTGDAEAFAREWLK
jgi:hypothetical protein